MGFIEIIIIALVEAMDCFAVAISTGLSKSAIRYRIVLFQAVSFGLFQGTMTLLGYGLGSFADRWFDSVGSTIACTILCVLGLRMIWSAFRNNGTEETLKNHSIVSILLLSLATSIDAFAVGVTFAFVKVNMVFATTAISIASLATGLIGFEIGRHTAKRCKSKIPEIVAGIILIVIGVKMLF